MVILFNSQAPEWAWLSNFSPHAVTDAAGLVWPTAEHAYQACKTLDPAQREMIRRQPNAAAAKASARRLVVRPGWDAIKLDVMGRVLRRKFAQHARLGERLVATANAELVHDTPWGDRFWGRCRGVGENHLGRILMGLRDELRAA